MAKSKSESIHLRLNNEIIKEIDNFKDEYFFTSRSDTIRYLIASGLKHHEITSKLLKQRKVDIQKYLDV